MLLMLKECDIFHLAVQLKTNEWSRLCVPFWFTEIRILLMN